MQYLKKIIFNLTNVKLINLFLSEFQEVISVCYHLSVLSYSVYTTSKFNFEFKLLIA